MERIRYSILAVALVAACAIRSAGATFTLTLSTSGPNSTSVVTSSDPVTGIQCGSSSTACSVSFPAGSTVTLSASVGSTVAFAGWGGTDGCGTNSTGCRILMSTNRSLSAKFNPLLNLSLYGNGGGSVVDDSATIACGLTGTCANFASATQGYPAGTHVRLTASTSTTGSTFTGWSGGTCTGTASSCSFVISTYTVVVATFSSSGPFTILVSTGGPGVGYVTSSPAGVSCGSTSTSCAAPFSGLATVTLTATPLAGYRFVGWANAGCSGTGTCVVVSTSAQQQTGGSMSPAAYFY